MLRLPLALLPCLVVGVLLGMTWPGLPARLAPFLTRWGIPVSLAALLLRSELSPTLLRIGLIGLLLPVLSLLILALSPLRRRLRDNVLLLGAAVGNTGYWGVPVALALLPPQAFAAVVAYDLAGTIVTWGLGPLILRGVQGGRSRLADTLVGSPAVQGFALAVIIAQTPWQGPLVQLLWWPARLVLWVALALVGMRLGLSLKQRNIAVSGGVPWALAIKLLLVPAMAWGLASLLRLPPLDRQALVLQAAAPTALSVLLIAEAERSAVPLASSLVLVSTGAAMVTVPLWWRLIR